MKKQLSLLMLGMAAMLTSCSQDETLLSETGGGATAVTFTATLDTEMKTRATGDDDNSKIARAVCAVYSDLTLADEPTIITGTSATAEGTSTKSFTFTLTDVKSNANYTFVFWADDGESYTTDSYLKNIALASGAAAPTLAYTLATTTTPAAIAASGVELKHAVAKVSLRSTTDIPQGKTVKLTVPTYAAFDATANTATGSLSTTAITDERTITEAITAGTTLASVYALGTQELTASGVSVSYESHEATVSNVPINPNKHVVLSGDVTQGYIDATFTALIDEDWSEEVAAPIAAVGDYYMSDGSLVSGLSTLTDEQKADCIGIVFALASGNAGEYDESDYTETGIGQKKCHGYVVALKDANDSKTCAWGEYSTKIGNTSSSLGNNSNYDDNIAKQYEWSGYKYTLAMKSKANGNGYDWTSAPSASDFKDYPAAYYAMNYGVEAPSGTSKWFLPAAGQLKIAIEGIIDSDSAIGKSYANVKGSSLGTYYWSSSEKSGNPENIALIVRDDGIVGDVGKFNDYDNSVRPILAF